MKASMLDTSNLTVGERRLFLGIAALVYLGFVCAVLFQDRADLKSLNPEGRATVESVIHLAQNGDIGDFVTITWNRRVLPEKMEWQNGEIVSKSETFVIAKRDHDGRSALLQGPVPDSNTNQVTLRFDPNVSSAMEWQKKIERISHVKRSDVGFNEFGAWYWLH